MTPLVPRPIVDRAAFIRANTACLAPPLVPEIRLHLAAESLPLWQATEDVLAESGLPPPYWAFAWAGGQALARHVLDHPEIVRGKTVLDFAAGSGLTAIAACLAGAGAVTAADIDAFAVESLGMNAALNGVAFAITADDIIGTDAGWGVVLAGDVFYEKPMADRIEPWLRRLAARGCLVLAGDPGRTYLPKQGLRRLADYSVPTTRELEDTDVRRTKVWRVVVD
ncbi:MAG: methyltransferase [Alphaproteobacteria bacterium]